MSEQFIGTWELISFKLTALDKVNIYPFSKNARGVLIYTTDGTMSAQIIRPKRKLFKGSEAHLGHGTPRERASAFKGYVAYFGKYKVNEQENSITHYVDGNLIPNEEGKEFTRYYKFEDDLLTLTTPPMDYKIITLTGVLVWKKRNDPT